MNRLRAYFDYNANAPLLPVARAAVVDALELTANASSVHAEGRKARETISRARGFVARLCDAQPADVVFTSGATEAANHVLTPDFKMGRSPVRISHLYMSAVEHPCVIAGGRFAAADITKLDVDSTGIIDFAALETILAARTPDTGPFMLALQLANNETGVIQPVRAVADMVHAAGGIMVVDAVQVAGRMPLDIGELGADFLILSAHKMGGPKGAGALVCKGEAFMPMPMSLVAGGGQEKGHRGGTENVPAIAGFGAAAEHALANPDAFAAVEEMRDDLEGFMAGLAPDIIFHGDDADRLPNTIYFSLPGLKAETAQIAFDMEGIAVSAGSACSSGKVGQSHVLAAMGADVDLGAIRASLGPQTTPEDIKLFFDAFAKINERRLTRRAAEEAA